MKFSIALIAKNESKTLPRLVKSLESFKERGGEILLVDTGSSDGTADVARSLGCKVFEANDKFRITLTVKQAYDINKQFIKSPERDIVKAGDSFFDFASARNFAASLASNDFIMMPDCDEVLTVLDIDKIEADIAIGPSKFRYWIASSHDSQGNDTTKYLHSRFYDRRKMSWRGLVHEAVYCKDGQADNSIVLNEDVIKVDHFKNESTVRKQYLIGLAYAAYQDPNEPRNTYYLGRELMYAKRYTSAIQVFNMRLAQQGWLAEKASASILLGDCWRALNLEDNAVGAWHRAFTIDPTFREPLMKIAEKHYWEKRPKQAIVFAEAALSIKTFTPFIRHEQYYRAFPHEILYWAYWQIGDKVKSKEHHAICLEHEPTNPRYVKDAAHYK